MHGKYSTYANGCRCDPCRKAWSTYMSDYYKRNPEIRHDKKNGAFVAAYKLERGCADCGYDKIAQALHLDHLPGQGKVASVSQMNHLSRKAIISEIAKCEVVCANCHAERTVQRREE